MSKPEVQDKNQSAPPIRPESFSNESMSTFSENEIRTRAYYIYESGDRNANSAVADWNQAKVELMELLGGEKH